MHRPVLGNVHDSDLSLIPSSDPLCMSLLARTPDPTGYLVPGRLTPGASFTDYYRPYQADVLRVHNTTDDRDLHNSYQSFHEDWTTQPEQMVSSWDSKSIVSLSTAGTWPMETDQLVGQQRPTVTSDFKLDSTMEDIIPLLDIPGPPPVPINFHNPWIENPNLSVGSSNPCDSLMQEFPISEHTPWPDFNQFEPGFDIPSTLSSLYEYPSDFTHKCEWSVDGSPCNAYYQLGDNLKHAVSQHLSKAHNLLPAGGKSTQKCLWLGCAKELKQESIVRHILTVHLHITTACKGCGTSFARQDSLQRHMRNSCGAGKKER